MILHEIVQFYFFIHLAIGLIFSLVVFRLEKPGYLTETVKGLVLILGIAMAWPYVLSNWAIGKIFK
jgi:hypothetical protein